MSPVKTVSVQGSVGVGKSSLLQYVESRFADLVQCVYEPVHKWTDLGGENLLKLFYKNPKKYAFALQSYVQLTMIEAHRVKLRNQSVKLKLMERSVQTSINVFAKQLNQNKVLDKVETSVLQEWNDFLLKEHNDLAVDVVIYLRATPDTCLERIRKRGREGEESITLAYLQELHQLHEDWLTAPDVNSFEILIVDTDKIQTEESLKREYDQIIDKILSN